MYIQLVELKSSDPTFNVPRTRNGEAMELFSVDTVGQFVVVRYVGTEPVAGPAVERCLVDLYCNADGKEAYRLTSRLMPSPPTPPTFWQRVRNAIHQLVP